MFNSLDQFLHILAQILLCPNDLYPIRVNKLAMIALYHVLNTVIYN